MTKEITKVRGTTDKLEADFALENAITQRIGHWLTIANFKKIETPILEKMELFIDSIGSETDVVSKELFFAQGKNPSDEKICLRPEMTAGVFRAFLENQAKLVTPWRVFATGPCFRYERPQKGRLRQFDQVDLEIIDAKSQFFDIEILLTLDRIFFHELRLINYVLKLNYIGSFAERAIFRGALLVFLETEQTLLCADCQNRRLTNPLRCLDCKNINCSDRLKKAPKITDFLDETSQANFTKIQQNLQMNSVNFTIDPLLVRGLDYYQGLVFEFVSSELGAQSTFCGGGRYELAQRLGGNREIPCVGAGIGLTRLCMLVDKERLLPKSTPLTAILPFTNKEEPLAIIIADLLRKHNHRCEIIFDKDSIKTKIRQAVRIGAGKVIFIGEEEIANNTLTVKNLETGIEIKASQQDILEII